MYATRQSVTVTTAADEAATAYTGHVSGRIFQMRYVAHGATPYENTVDFTITAEATGEIIFQKQNIAASFTIAPRQATHDTGGVASLYAGGGEPVEDYIVLANDRIKIVLAQGGVSKIGTFHFIVG